MSDEFEGFVIREQPVIVKEKPVPYIIDFSVTGVLRIGWDRPMTKGTDAEKLRSAKVACAFDVYNEV